MRAHLRPTVPDAVVTLVLIVWTFLGAAAPDDGYILTMGRAADASGYLSNYYRFYGVAEAPFDWYYSFLGLWSHVSTSIVWMHLPILVAGLVSWFVLSRIVLPHLMSGRSVAGPVGRFGATAWSVATAAAVFLAFWLPYCSGLRTEGVIVLGSLLTWWATESAITRRRLLPAALAATLAASMLALAPQGVIGVAILLIAARPLLHVLVDRRREGLTALIAPLVAAGTVVSVIVFRDQTLATVVEAVKTRYSTGPIIPWHQEFLRYFFLTVTTADGALARRIPVLLLFVAAIVTAAVLLRRRSIAGVGSGPTWRLIGAVGVTLLLFFLSPVKWTIHFGVFAGLGAALAAIACLAIAQAGARSSRNLAVLTVGLLFALAAAAAGKNAWPYAYRYGITWFDMAPAVRGIQISTVLLVLAVAAVAVTLWLHLRGDYVRNRGLAHHDAGQPDSRADRRRLMLAHTPLALIAGLMVVATLGVFGKAVVQRDPAMTVFSTNIDSLGTDTCGMADQVLAEPDPNDGMLTPADGESATRALTGTTPVGFTPNGLPDDLTPKPSSARAGQMHVAGSVSKPFTIIGGLGAGTTGGRGPTTVNGSHHALPFGLDPATTPILGSYGYQANAFLTTGWYTLPARDTSPIIAISVAGAVSTLDRDQNPNFGQRLVAQFGTRNADGRFTQVGPNVIPIDAGPITPNLPWRNLRVPMTAAPPGATVMRLDLADTNLGPAQFMAITPPRAPHLVTLQELVGSTDPTLIDFMAAAQFPCQAPMTFPHGVAQVPRWRILPDFVTANSQSRTWMAADGGGPLSVVESTTSQVTVPTYLRDDWYEDWGSLEKLSPLSPNAAIADVHTVPVTRWGWSRTGSIRLEPDND